MIRDKRVNCIDCGQPIAPHHNPNWCKPCDDKRIARITASMEELAKGWGITPLWEEAGHVAE